jgi:epoxyqueuosine reductase
MNKKYYLYVCLSLTIGFGYMFLPTAVWATEDISHTLLRTSGYAGIILGIIGIGIAGYFSGKSYDGHTGWERFTHGAGQFFNRKPFEKDQPTYGITKDHQRVGYEHSLFHRMGSLRKAMAAGQSGQPAWTPKQSAEGLSEPFRSFYLNNDEKYRQAVKALALMKKQKEDWPKYRDRYAIIDSWDNAMSSNAKDINADDLPHEMQYPTEPNGPPEVWDYRNIRDDVPPNRFKSPEHAAKLIKKITHTFGATIVGITRLNPDWCYQGYLRGVGEGDYEVPKHWKYAIVFGCPMEWDQFYVNPTYGSSMDGYSNARVVAGRLERFLQHMGYPARSHVPPKQYDIMMPPVAVDAGLGEQSRMGLLITPELGANVRLACVTTDLPMEVNKPIDVGIQDFCKKCKICVKSCPSGAISPREEPGIEFGYKRWKIRDELCFNIWCSVATSKQARGCRICLTVCPYSRKNNWIHAISRTLDPRDPTGLVSSALLWMQKAFFKYPKAKDYMPPPLGTNATYHKPPDWLLTENWLDVKKDW